MRSLAAIAAILVIGLIPAGAQRGGSHGGGFSGHAGGGFHGGFSGHAPGGGFQGGFSGHAPLGGPRIGSGPSGFSGRAPIGAPTNHIGSMPFNRPGSFGTNQLGAPFRLGGGRVPYNGSRSGTGYPYAHGGPVRPPYGGGHDRDHDRRSHWGYGGWGNGIYLAGSYPWIGYPGFYDWGYPYNDYYDDYDNSDNGGNPGYANGAPGYYPPYANAPYANDPGPDPNPDPNQDAYAQAAPQPDPPQQSARAPYNPGQQSMAPAAPPRPQPPVTVIFKDGRAPEQVHNYLLTPSTLTILDSGYHSIPLDLVDIAATEQANRNAGIDFRVPKGTR